MGDEVFAHDVAEGVFELDGLDEEVVFGVETGGAVGSLEVEGEPLLDAEAAQAGRAGGEVEEEAEVEGEGGGEDGVAAEEVDLELHGVAEPAEDVDVVPALLVVAARWVVVDADLVVEVLVELRVELGLEDDVEDAELGLFLGLEGLGVIEDLAVAVAEDVGGVPAGDAEHAGLEGGGEDGLDEGLAGLEVLAADGCVHPAGELVEGGDVDGEVGCAVGEGDALLEGGPGVEHGGGDVGVVVDQAFFKGFEGLVDGGLLEEDLGGAAPDHDLAVGFGLELGDVVADLVGEVALVLALLGAGAVEALDVVLVEGAGHGLDGLEEGLDLGELIAVEDLGVRGGVEEVAAEDVPAGEDEVGELGDGGEVLDEGGAIVGALAEADGAHLGGGANGLGKASADGFDTGDQGGGDGSHAGDHDAELALCGGDIGRLWCGGGFGCGHCAGSTLLWSGIAGVADRLVSRTGEGWGKWCPAYLQLSCVSFCAAYHGFKRRIESRGEVAQVPSLSDRYVEHSSGECHLQANSRCGATVV